MAALILLAYGVVTGSSQRSARDSEIFETALIYLLIGFPPAILMRETYRVEIPTLLLVAQLFTLGLIACIEISCLLIIADVQTSMEFSISFTILDQFGTNFLIGCIIIASILAILTSITLLVLTKQQRMFALGLLLLSLALLPSAYAYAIYFGDNTEPAILRHQGKK